MGRYSVLITIFLVLVSGCSGLQVNMPIEVGPVIKREHAALWVLVENQSNHQIKISYPISTGMLQQSQYIAFRLPKLGNYKAVITAYAQDSSYPTVYRPIKTIEVPIFLNGYDIVQAKDTYAGYYLVVTDGMLFPER